MVPHSTQILSVDDGHKIQTRLWQPHGVPIAIVQVVHGLGEHADRYARFAEAAVKRGFAVCAHDHRGHGCHAEHPGYFALTKGWDRVVNDVDVVNEFVRRTVPGVPVVLLGHSMGSYIAQNYAMYHSERLAGMILSASTWPSKAKLLPAFVIAHIEAWRLGASANSRLLHKLGFSDFNRPFNPARTELDWLSRDADEVDKYIADPLCGGPYTCGLCRALFGGLLRIYSDNSLRSISSDLPILITGGELDAVGGDKGMGRLATHYAQTLHSRLKVRIYPEGRHEMLNEVNRDEVTRDWLDWVATTTGTSRSD
jgi:alpha-beta hydrolase superfamily lysophospholipase